MRTNKEQTTSFPVYFMFSSATNPLATPSCADHLALFQGGQIHEIQPADGDEQEAASATGFAVTVLARWLTAQRADLPLIWVSGQADLYGPGLAMLGLDPARLLMVQASEDSVALACLEAALRAGLSGLVESAAFGRVAGRRLALAARAGRAMGLVLRRRPYGAKKLSSEGDSFAVSSRWRIEAAPSLMLPGRSPGRPRWRAEILYARGQAGGKNFCLEGAYHGTDALAGHRFAGLADPPADQRRFGSA
jgi:protein ImuA